MLSCGHSSLTLYLQLYLSGYGLTLDDIEHYRTWGSLHPRSSRARAHAGGGDHHRAARAGPANAVGMAMAARRERGLLDPDAAPGTSPFDHHIYAFVSDGDIEEGISHEASSLAAHQELGNLIVLYDDNSISIEDDTNIAKSEDVAARYEAYGWHVQRVDLAARRRATTRTSRPWARRSMAARDNTVQPSFIALRTIIAWPAPTQQNTGEAHGVGARRRGGGHDQAHPGLRPGRDLPRRGRGGRPRAHGRRPRQAAARAEWEESFAAWAAAQTRSGRAAGPAVRPAAARRLGRRAAGVPARRQGDGHPEGLRRSPDRARPGAPRAVGRLGRPGRQQQHDDEGRALVHPARAPDPHVPRQHVRAHAAFRHPRARHGRDLQRDRAARADPALRRHVPGVQRLHAARGAAGGAHGAAGDVRVDARLDRAGRGRAHPPAGRAPVGAARHPRPGRRAPGRRERDRGRLADDPRPQRPARRACA